MRKFFFSEPPRQPWAEVPSAIVAIPVKDEADRLPACLNALDRQTDSQGRLLRRGAFGVVVFANNCRDRSAETARKAAAELRFPMRVYETQLPPELAHAGGARRAAMDLAEGWLAETSASDGVILTTDADSAAAPDWIAANLDAFAAGADAVLGRISLDEEGARLPPMLHARGKLEAVYEDLLAEMSALLDPQDCNPWPHHTTISGATLAVTRRAYLSVGGLPRVPLGEDKAFVAELRRRDARIRFAPDVVVVTSGRTAGRAPGGVADTLRLRSAAPDALCDEALEPCTVAYRRALWRGRLRRAKQVSTGFGEAWERIEGTHPRLARRALAPAELPRQIELATRTLRRLQARLAALEDVEPVTRAALSVDDLDGIL